MGGRKAKKRRRKKIKLATAILLAITTLIELVTAIISMVK